MMENDAQEMRANICILTSLPDVGNKRGSLSDYLSVCKIGSCTNINPICIAYACLFPICSRIQLELLRTGNRSREGWFSHLSSVKPCNSDSPGTSNFNIKDFQVKKQYYKDYKGGDMIRERICVLKRGEKHSGAFLPFLFYQ